MKIRMTVKGLMVDPVTNMPMIVLRGDPEPYVLPIWVGVFEANAIALRLEGIEPPRPMTHDLLRITIERLGATVIDVTVSDLDDSTFLAIARLKKGDEEIVLDCRPSDAIALALRTGAPIYADEGVIEKAQAFDVGSEDPKRLKSWFENLDEEDLGTYEM